MAISVADNFSYKGSKPLDARIQYNSVADMKAVAEADLYDGCKAYVKATKKFYTYDSTNTVDSTTGKWREDSAGGGGGSSNLSDLDDVDISEPSDGQSLVFDEATQKWVNGSGGSGGASSLNELTDVSADSPANNDILQFNNATHQWENKQPSQSPSYVTGYAYTKPLTTAKDYIDRINELCGNKITYSSASLFSGKTCNALYMILCPDRAYLLFSEAAFTLIPYSLKKSGYFCYVSSRYSTDGNNHSGYKADPFTYANGITALTAVTIKGSSETDVDQILDNDKVGTLYYSANVTVQASAYSANSVLIDSPLRFYSDSAHTQVITPTTNVIYIDNSTQNMYKWDGSKYVKIGGASNYNDLSNKPKINNVELNGNKTAANLGLATELAVNAKQNQFQLSTMPTAAAAYAGKTYQYIGATNANYTHNYFYECVENSGSYSWQVSQVQNNPSSTGHTIVNSSDESMAARANLKFGDGFNVTDDSKDNETIVEPTPLASGDMDDIVFPLPTVPHPNTNCGFTPVGTVISVMGNEAPLHYLACNGQVVNIADYPELADYFEAQFGSKNQFGGDGTTTFGIPDLRGEFLRGTGTNSHLITNGNGAYEGNGAEVGTHQGATWVNQIGGNADTTKTSGIYIGFDNTNYRYPSQRDSIIKTSKNIASNVGNFNASSSSNDANWSDYHTTRPTNTSVLYCIATKDIYINPLLDYSTTEKVVGTWVDGKPIYQKTFTNITVTPTTAAGTVVRTQVDVSSLNISECISIDAMIKSSSINQTTKAPAVSTTGETNGALCCVYKIQDKLIEFQNSAWTSALETITGTVTIKYTKTT